MLTIFFLRNKDKCIVLVFYIWLCTNYQLKVSQALKTGVHREFCSAWSALWRNDLCLQEPVVMAFVAEERGNVTAPSRLYAAERMASLCRESVSAAESQTLKAVIVRRKEGVVGWGSWIQHIPLSQYYSISLQSEVKPCFFSVTFSTWSSPSVRAIKLELIAELSLWVAFHLPLFGQRQYLKLLHLLQLYTVFFTSPAPDRKAWRSFYSRDLFHLGTTKSTRSPVWMQPGSRQEVCWRRKGLRWCASDGVFRSQPSIFTAECKAAAMRASSIKSEAKILKLNVWWAYPNEKRAWGRPRTCWRKYTPSLGEVWGSPGASEECC